ncbi:MAG: helix-turn-helix transcriptional regulator [Clostridia bacterium]|nr:helix-turn-helix transcriptional regulator [Clostridia bacterium]
MEGFGYKIKKARQDYGLSQSEIAKQIPMNQSNYSKIENDGQEPNLEQLKRICEILHLDPNYLLSIDEYSGISGKDIELLKDIKATIKKYTK